MELIRQGCTLIIDAVDELSDPTAQIAMRLERLLHLQVGACAYFTGSTEQGFESHTDQVDIFVLQLAGSKRWRIHEPTRELPLLRDVAFAPQSPEKLVLDQVLSTGDVLYLPRGWWHSAETTEPPALHISLGIAPACGVDLLEWVAEQLLRCTTFRRDLPINGSAEEQAMYMAGLLEAITGVWNDDLLREFVRYRDLQARARQRFGLPTSATATATASTLPTDDDFLVHFAAPRAYVEVDADAVRLHADGRRWTFRESVAGLLEILVAGETPHIREIYDRYVGTICRADIRILLEDLQAAGLVYCTPVGDAQP
jgi:ribosomal protein L16 Arg81 hydroxylase